MVSGVDPAMLVWAMGLLTSSQQKLNNKLAHYPSSVLLAIHACQIAGSLAAAVAGRCCVLLGFLWAVDCRRGVVRGLPEHTAATQQVGRLLSWERFHSRELPNFTLVSAGHLLQLSCSCTPPASPTSSSLLHLCSSWGAGGCALVMVPFSPSSPVVMPISCSTPFTATLTGHARCSKGVGGAGIVRPGTASGQGADIYDEMD